MSLVQLTQHPGTARVPSGAGTVLPMLPEMTSKSMKYGWIPCHTRKDPAHPEPFFERREVGSADMLAGRRAGSLRPATLAVMLDVDVDPSTSDGRRGALERSSTTRNVTEPANGDRASVVAAAVFAELR
jgi:hypothetical protein